MNAEKHLQIADAIARYGIAIGGTDEDGEQRLTHSIGRYQRGWPELAILADNDAALEEADALIYALADTPVRPGDRLHGDGENSGWIAVSQAVGLAPHERLRLWQAEEYFGQEVPLLVLIPERELLRGEQLSAHHLA